MTDVLTLQAAAKTCGLSTRTLRRAINAGELVASELAKGRWVVYATDLHAWIDARATRPRDVTPVLVAETSSPRRPRRGDCAGGLSAALTDEMGRRAA